MHDWWESKYLKTVVVVYIKELLFFGLCPPSGTLKTRKHNLSETGSVPVLR
jgi:hypothetical protein